MGFRESCRACFHSGSRRTRWLHRPKVNAVSNTANNSALFNLLAAHAMTGLLSNITLGTWDEEMIADSAISHAEALMKKLDARAAGETE